MNAQEMPLRELIILCLQADQKVWGEFLRRTQPKIALAARKRACWYVRNPTPDLIDDLVSDTYVKVCEKDYRVLRTLAGFEEYAVFGYLRQMAANLVTDHFRKNPPVTDEIPEEDPPVAPNDEERIAANIYWDQSISFLRVKIAHEETCERDLRIFAYYIIDGYTAKEIGQIFHMPTKAVENVIGRLRRFIRENRGAGGSND